MVIACWKFALACLSATTIGTSAVTAQKGHGSYHPSLLRRGSQKTNTRAPSHRRSPPGAMSGSELEELIAETAHLGKRDVRSTSESHQDDNSRSQTVGEREVLEMQKQSQASFTKASSSQSATDLDSESSRSSRGTTSQWQCIFDDHLFGLTSEAKTELVSQLGQMAANVNFVQRGGSRYCGKWNDDCHCRNGFVVFGSDTLNLWSSPAYQVPVTSPTGTIKCGVDMNLPKEFSDSIQGVFGECRCFGQFDDAPIPTRAGSKPFMMEKKLNSWSYLQESWIMLTRLLALHGMMPLGTGDRLYNGLNQWSKRGGRQSSVIEIGYINRFLEESAIQLGLTPFATNVIGLLNSSSHMMDGNSTNSPGSSTDREAGMESDAEGESSDSADVETNVHLSFSRYRQPLPVRGVPARTGLTCLEWGINYMTRMDLACTRKITVEYEPIANGIIPKPGQLDTTTYGPAKNVLYSDIVDFPTVLRQSGNVFIDIIIATQVWEHLAKPKESAVALFQSLAPGGVLIFTVPQLAQYHEVPGDFFRYTKEGILLLMTEAGFCVPKSQMASGGDFVIDVARTTGLQMEDWTADELKSGYIRGYDRMSDGATTLMGLAFKPPFGVGAEECWAR